jgi:hypothetical protein
MVNFLGQEIGINGPHSLIKAKLMHGSSVLTKEDTSDYHVHLFNLCRSTIYACIVHCHELSQLLHFFTPKQRSPNKRKTIGQLVRIDKTLLFSFFLLNFCRIS